MAQAPALVGSSAPEAVNRISLPLLRVRERRLLLAAVDGLIAGGILLFAYELWKAGAHPAADNMDAIPWAWVLGGCLTWVTISWLAGSYELDVADRALPALKRTFTVGIFAAAMGLLAYWLFLKTYPRPALAMAIPSATAAVLAWRGLYAGALHRPASATKVLVLGGEDAYLSLCSVAQHGHYYRIVGYHPIVDGAELGLEGSVQALGVHRVVIAPRLRLTDQVIADLTAAIERGVEVLDFNTAYEEMAGKLAVEHVGDQWLASLPTRPQTSAFEEAGMRALDLVGAILGGGLTLLIFPAVAFVIRLSSRGPILYRQERLGRGGSPFTIFKFRTMRVDAEAKGARWARANDSRITPAGRFLRATHLDELPQLWNVLRGEMSLVGPRPERPEFTESLSREIPFYRLRHSVRPGVTGLKQIKVGYAASPAEHLEVLRHDLYYIKHRSLALNLAIMARTLGSVVGRTGR